MPQAATRHTLAMARARRPWTAMGKAPCAGRPATGAAANGTAAAPRKDQCAHGSDGPSRNDGAHAGRGRGDGRARRVSTLPCWPGEPLGARPWSADHRAGRRRGDEAAPSRPLAPWSPRRRGRRSIRRPRAWLSTAAAPAVFSILGFPASGPRLTSWRPHCSPPGTTLATVGLLQRSHTCPSSEQQPLQQPQQQPQPCPP